MKKLTEEQQVALFGRVLTEDEWKRLERWVTEVFVPAMARLGEVIKAASVQFVAATVAFAKAMERFQEKGE